MCGVGGQLSVVQVIVAPVDSEFCTFIVITALQSVQNLNNKLQ